MKTIRFIFISLSVALSLSCATSRHPSASAPEVLLSLEQTGRYRVRVQSARMELTGVLIVKHAGGEWRGSLINEFGIKAFDFIAGKKCRLLNTLPLLNKWYVRRTIESDLSFLFRAAQGGEAVKGKRLTPQAGGAFRLQNERRKVEYFFQPLDN